MPVSFALPKKASPPNATMCVPVHTATWSIAVVSEKLLLMEPQVSVAGSYHSPPPPTAQRVPCSRQPPHTITRDPVHRRVAPVRVPGGAEVVVHLSSAGS